MADNSKFFSWETLDNFLKRGLTVYSSVKQTELADAQLAEKARQADAQRNALITQERLQAQQNEGMTKTITFGVITVVVLAVIGAIFTDIID